jgi:hypothetical protein
MTMVRAPRHGRLFRRQVDETEVDRALVQSMLADAVGRHQSRMPKAVRQELVLDVAEEQRVGFGCR